MRNITFHSFVLFIKGKRYGRLLSILKAWFVFNVSLSRFAGLGCTPPATVKGREI